jgi:hypothetical protein
MRKRIIERGFRKIKVREEEGGEEKRRRGGEEV